MCRVSRINADCRRAITGTSPMKLSPPNQPKGSPMTNARNLNRREMLKTTGLAAAALTVSPFSSRLGFAAAAADDSPKKKILFFTRSQGFQHSVIDRKGNMDKLSYAEEILTDLGAKHGFEVTCSKDGAMFAPDKRDQFDAFVFYTTGGLTKPGTDKQPPMSEGDKAGLLDAIKNGKGFMALHCGSDTFHSSGH